MQTLYLVLQSMQNKSNFLWHEFLKGFFPSRWQPHRYTSAQILYLVNIKRRGPQPPGRTPVFVAC